MPYKGPTYQFRPELQVMEILKDRVSAIHYQQGMSFFHEELVHLRATIYVLERIRDFPWDVFVGFAGWSYSQEKMMFFKLVGTNFLEYGVLLATKLYEDKPKQAHDLGKFKGDVLNKLIMPQFRKTFRLRLEKVNFDAEVVKGFEKAKKLRDKYLAHSDRTLHDFRKVPSNSPGLEEGIALELTELRDLFDALETLYMALLLGEDGRGLPLKQESDIYARPNHYFHEFFLKKNMDNVLDNIAKNSRAWDLPETAPKKLMQFTNEQIARLDTYRQERGIPKIALTREQYDAINDNRGWGRNPKLPPTYLRED